MSSSFPASTHLQELLDRAEIRDVLMRYFHAADRGDKTLVRSCFTEDVQARYHGRDPVFGADGLIAQIALFDDFDSGACVISTHFVGNLRFVAISAKAAETETNAFAFLVRPGASHQYVAMRSLRYLDRWVREESGWRICARVHTLDWSCDLPVSDATTLAQRLNTFPAQFGPV